MPRCVVPSRWSCSINFRCVLGPRAVGLRRALSTDQSVALSCLRRYDVALSALASGARPLVAAGMTLRCAQVSTTGSPSSGNTTQPSARTSGSGPVLQDSAGSTSVMLIGRFLEPCGAFTQLTELTREACPGIQLEDGLAKEARDRGRQRWSATRCVADVSVALRASPSRKQPPPHTSSNALSQPSPDSEVVRNPTHGHKEPLLERA